MDDEQFTARREDKSPPANRISLPETSMIALVEEKREILAEIKADKTEEAVWERDNLELRMHVALNSWVNSSLSKIRKMLEMRCARAITI